MSDRDSKWMTEHSIELQKLYAGKWIPVYDRQVVGVGDTALEAAEQARTKAEPGEYILEALDRETDVIYLHREATGGRRDDFENFLAAVSDIPPSQDD